MAREQLDRVEFAMREETEIVREDTTALREETESLRADIQAMHADMQTMMGLVKALVPSSSQEGGA